MPHGFDIPNFDVSGFPISIFLLDLTPNFTLKISISSFDIQTGRPARLGSEEDEKEIG